MRGRHALLISAAVLLGSLVVVLTIVFSRQSGSESVDNGNGQSSSSSGGGGHASSMSSGSSSESVTSTGDTHTSGSSQSAASGSSSSGAPSSEDHIQWSIRNGSVKSRGVNLGGWLVAEYWMTQDAAFWSTVGAADRLGGEYIAITSAPSPSTVRAQLKTHHSTYITEDDIKEIAAVGLNTVRVPVGWWIIGKDDYDTSNTQRWRVFPDDTLHYLDLLITKWAKKYNVAVLVSMHAAKGSQNGEQHSAPTDLGKSYWSDYPENVDNTIEVVSFLADRYKDEDAFLGITLLNGPAGTTDVSVLLQYYKDAYKTIRSAGNACILSIMALSYGNVDLAGSMLSSEGFINVWIEWHPYFAFGYDSYTDSQLINAVTDTYQDILGMWSSVPDLNAVFIGEWSVAVPAGQFSGEEDDFYKFVANEFEVFAQAEGGWAFFSWKTSDEYPGWSMKELLTDSKLRALLEENLKT